MMVIGMMLFSVAFCFMAEHFPELVVIGFVYVMTLIILEG